MSKYNYTEEEKKINAVLKYQSEKLKSISFPDKEEIDSLISNTERILDDLKIESNNLAPVNCAEKTIIKVPRWETLSEEAEKACGKDIDLESLFSSEELAKSEFAIKLLNDEFNQIHKLDKIDITICVVAGILSATIDILLVGIPEKTKGGLSAKPLSDFIRKEFEQKFPVEEMEKIANSPKSKVPYDAQDNRNTVQNITGLSAYYHRLLSLGHDPLLGFVVGVFDILNGKMTTIDKSGKLISQVMENYSDRIETNIFSAIAKQFMHIKSDITTSMGLPVPLMGLFNFFQFGSIGEEEQTIAEIVQSMYYEGYDFIHFCSMSIPVMITEVIVRLGYAIKRVKEGNKVKDSIPYSTDRESLPKLGTMLFIAHSTASLINLGKIYFTKNPMAINYPQWIAFAKYTYTQLKWTLIESPERRNAYVMGILHEQLNDVFSDINNTYNKIGKNYIIEFE